ncbi:MAG: S9 family peptidase [Vicinamibacteraceae bacterium]
MGRTNLGCARSGVAGVVCLLALGPTAEAQRPSGPPRQALKYDQAFGTAAYGGADQPSLLADVPTIGEWVDAAHYLETRREADGRRRVYLTAAADGTSRLVGAAEASTVTAPGAAFRVVLRNHDLVRIDADGKERQLTATPADEGHARLSPDGARLAYTRGNDLFAYDLATGLEHQLTADGSETILNGTPSWIYLEEILGRGSNAFWWSPDGSRLAFMRFDDARVPVFPIYHADGQHGELERTRYPKAGDPNPYVRIGIVSVADGKTTWMDFEEKADHYLSFPKWSVDGRTLYVQWMNRAQDTLKLFACDAATGKASGIHQETQRSWVDWYDDLTPLADGSLLFVSDVDGWRHLYRYAKGEPAVKQLTRGAWRVHQILEVADGAGLVYFSGRPLKSWDTQVMRLKLAGGEPEIVTKEPGVHKAAVSPDGAYVVDTWTTLATPTRVVLRRGDGSVVREIADAGSAPGYGRVAWGKAELFTIPSSDGTFQLPAYWILPADFSPSRRYPVIMTVYGGPDAGSVQNGWPGLTAHYWAQRGVITVSVDHRGSGHFGKAGTALMHRQLGTWEMTDLSTAAAWLRARPFVQGDRIGITGSSYGGYTTAMAMTQAAGQFNFGIAGSSVTDWQLYDSVYTERYMDLPSENPQGYKAGAVLTWVDRYKAGLRLTHGTIDDNVHLQQTLQVCDWLTSHDKRFELMIYPNSRHGIQLSQRAHQARESHDFWVRNLLAGRLPDVVIETRMPARSDTTVREKKVEKAKEKERTP